MKLFFGKGKIVEQKILEYLEQINEEKVIFEKTILKYLKEKEKIKLKKRIIDVHTRESRADDIKREIVSLMYSQALLPDFRQNVMEMVERLDEIPNKMEMILFILEIENLKIPRVIYQDIKSLINKGMISIDRTIDAVKALLRNPGKVEEIINDIDIVESDSDKLERKIIKEIFKLKMVSDISRILLRDFVIEIAAIPDFAEHAGDIINIINMKVKV